MSMDRFDLSGRVALVTGAAGGFGREISRGLSEHGASVVAADIDEAGLEETRQAIDAIGGRCLSVRCDISSADDVERLVAESVSSFSSVDILVNNAVGPLVREHPENYPLDSWEATLRTDLTGYFLCAKFAGRQMIAQRKGGSIINVSSIAGSTALGRGNFVYSVSKAAVLQLTRELAIEWAQHGIRVNAIQPCQFLTAGWKGMLGDPEKKPWVDRVLGGIPLGRLGAPSEIVGPCVFLASGAASMVTGAVLAVDGGNLALNATGSTLW